MLIAASISEMMTTEFDALWARGGRLKIRFRAPVFPGDRIVTFGQVREVRERDGARIVDCSVGVKKEDGEVAITGVASVSIPI